MKKKVTWAPGNMLYPLPAVMVSLADRNGKPNIITLAWAGTVCSSPPMVSVSIRPERYSYDIIKETGEFVINLTTKSLTFATDYCGVKSGRDVDKFKEMHLTPCPSEKIGAPAIAESPVNLECKVKEIIQLGSHDAFLAEVVNVRVNEELLDERNRFHLDEANLIAYSHGRYYELGEEVGSFGYSIRKKAEKENLKKGNRIQVKKKNGTERKDLKKKDTGMKTENRKNKGKTIPTGKVKRKTGKKE